MKRSPVNELVKTARPTWSRGDRVNVDGIGEGLSVLSVKLGSSAWWIEARMSDGRTWSVPSDRVWS